jgi:large repetitive protein
MHLSHHFSKSIVILLIFLSMAISHPLFGDTPVTGRITQNTTWTVDGSPYIISTAIEIGNDYYKPTLTIEPGVEVRFDPGGSLIVGYGNPNYTKHYGALVAAGTADQEILFTSNSQTPAQGIGEV